jgi:UDP-N-acetylmuramate dehydrogenase
MDGGTKIFIMNINNNFIRKFKTSFSQNVNLSNYSWFNLGGNAEFFFKPTDKSQLIEFLIDAKKNNLKTTILGAGSNTLFRDNGVKGAVIKLSPNFSNIKLIDDDTIEVGAAALDRKLANFAKENNLANFEFLSCIPGSIGGAVSMNSGCYENDISKILVSIQVIDTKDCKEKEIKKENIKFLYRGTNLSKDLIIVSAKFKGSISDKEEIEKKQQKYIEQKKKNSTKSNKNLRKHF